MVILVEQYVAFISLSSSYLFFKLLLVVIHLIWLFYVICFSVIIRELHFLHLHFYRFERRFKLCFISHLLEFSPNSSLVRIIFWWNKTKVTWVCFTETVSNIAQCAKVGDTDFVL